MPTGRKEDCERAMEEPGAPKPKSLFGIRHVQAILLFLGNTVAFMQRVNVSVGLVAMTDTSQGQDYEILNYTTPEKGIISSAFFYGYLLTGPMAGVLCDKYGAIKLLSTVGGLSCGVLTILIPFASTHTSGIWAICSLRVLQGLAQGIFLPATNSHLANWVIPEERGKFSWVYTGAQMGTIIMMSLSGVIVTIAGGWPSIYYFSGFSSILLGICGLLFGSRTPMTDKRISKEERDYIITNLKAKTHNEIQIPWKSIVTSRPVLILILVHLCNSWGFFTLLTLLPTYIHGVYDMSLNANGLLSALPYIGMLLSGLVISTVADKLAAKKSVNFTRKFWNSVGFYGPSIALLILSVVTTDATVAIILLTIATSCNAGTFAGFMSNHADLAPNLTGVLMGITNGLSNFASITAPSWATFVVKDESNSSQWQTVFLVSAAVFGVGNTLFLLLGSTKLQTWNNCSQDSNEVEKMTVISGDSNKKELTA